MIRTVARGFVAGLFGLALILSFTAPASAEAVTLWHSFRGREAEALETAVAAFNEAHENQVKLVAIDGAEYIARVESALAEPGAGSPDLVVWAHDKIVPWARRGWLLPLDSRIDSAELSDFIPQCVTPLRHESKLYGLPLSFESLMLYYNRNLVDRAPRTTNEMLATARRFADPRRDRWGIVYERANFYFHAMWLHGFGGQVFDARGNFAVRSPAMLKSLAFARDLARVQHVIPDTVDWERQMAIFNSGRAPFLISGPWAYGSLAWDRIPIGIAPLPLLSPSRRHPAPFLGVKAFAVAAHSPRVDLAVEVMRHLTSPFSGCLMNVVAGYMPANRRAYEFDALSSHPLTARPQVFWDSAVLMPTDVQMQHVWTVMMRDDVTGEPGCLDRVFAGTRPEVAAREAERRWRALAAPGALATPGAPSSATTAAHR